MPCLSKLMLDEILYLLREIPHGLPVRISKTLSRVEESFYQLRVNDEEVYEDLLEKINDFIPTDED